VGKKVFIKNADIVEIVSNAPSCMRQKTRIFHACHCIGRCLLPTNKTVCLCRTGTRGLSMNPPPRRIFEMTLVVIGKYRGHDSSGRWISSRASLQWREPPPLLLQHRNSGEENNRLRLFQCIIISAQYPSWCQSGYTITCGNSVFNTSRELSERSIVYDTTFAVGLNWITEGRNLRSRSEPLKFRITTAMCVIPSFR